MDPAELIRKATRPVVTIIFTAAIARVVVGSVEAPDWFVGLSVSIIAFWFGERSIGHLAGK
jgi:hypothetical protein